jgi:hypothetical protein
MGFATPCDPLGEEKYLPYTFRVEIRRENQKSKKISHFILCLSGLTPEGIARYILDLGQRGAGASWAVATYTYAYVRCWAWSIIPQTRGE